MWYDRAVVLLRRRLLSRSMAAPSGPGYASRASYIPLRLDPTERSLLRVLEGATHQLARSPPPRAA